MTPDTPQVLQRGKALPLWASPSATPATPPSWSTHGDLSPALPFTLSLSLCFSLPVSSLPPSSVPVSQSISPSISCIYLSLSCLSIYLFHSLSLFLPVPLSASSHLAVSRCFSQSLSLFLFASLPSFRPNFLSSAPMLAPAPHSSTT